MYGKIKALILFGIVSMALVGYTIGNIAPIMPRIEYVDKIEYVDRIEIEYVDRVVEYLPRNTWQVNYGYYFYSSSIPTSNGTMFLREVRILNAEYASQNATIQFGFAYKYPANISHFVYSIGVMGEMVDGRLFTAEGVYFRIALATVTRYGLPLQQGEDFWSKVWNFTTPDHIGTYVISISVQMAQPHS